MQKSSNEPETSKGSRRNRGAEQQSFGDSETKSHGDSESQSFRETDGFRAINATHGTEDSVLTARVSTLPEAVQISLAQGVTGNSLFIYARVLLAFEATTGVKLQPADLESAFAEWWRRAKPILPPDAEFDEYRFLFMEACASARIPWGSNVLQQAIGRAETEPEPPECERYKSPGVRKLVIVCWQLQRISGEDPFFLSVRSAQTILGTLSPRAAHAALNGLVRDGILVITAKGKPGKSGPATRFRYITGTKSLR